MDLVSGELDLCPEFWIDVFGGKFDVVWVDGEGVGVPVVELCGVFADGVDAAGFDVEQH